MPLSFASCAKGGTVDRPILGVCTPNSDCYEAGLSLAIVPSVGLAAAGAKRLFFFRSKLSLPGGEGPASRSELRDGMLFAHPAEPAEQMGDRGAVAQAGGLAERRQIAEESVGHTSIVGDGIAAESSGPASGCCAWKRKFEGAFGLAHKTCADPITPSQPKNDERLAGQGADPLVRAGRPRPALSSSQALKNQRNVTL